MHPEIRLIPTVLGESRGRRLETTVIRKNLNSPMRTERILSTRYAIEPWNGLAVSDSRKVPCYACLGERSVSDRVYCHSSFNRMNFSSINDWKGTFDYSYSNRTVIQYIYIRTSSQFDNLHFQNFWQFSKNENEGKKIRFSPIKLVEKWVIRCATYGAIMLTKHEGMWR